MVSVATYSVNLHLKHHDTKQDLQFINSLDIGLAYFHWNSTQLVSKIRTSVFLVIWLELTIRDVTKNKNKE